MSFSKWFFRILIFGEVVLLLAVLWFLYGQRQFDSLFGGNQSDNSGQSIVDRIVNKPEHGKLISSGEPEYFDLVNTKTLINQTNQGVEPIYQVTKQDIVFSSLGKNDREIELNARVYFPDNVEVAKKLPVVVFATGTTGISDICAASLEKPNLEPTAINNWGNYQSEMISYASQGYIMITPDYEGMRDPEDIHHYMIGELEGRVMLDALLASREMASIKSNADQDLTFMSGFSQGGHAAYWADKISQDYASLTVDGVVGFGPVSSVTDTILDIAKNANINWFTPFVLYSYQDYYNQTFDISRILLPNYISSLQGDIESTCINAALGKWPWNGGVYDQTVENNRTQLYTSEFLGAITSGNLSSFDDLFSKTDANEVGKSKTDSYKLINQGDKDNVILPSQSDKFFNRLCQAGNNVIYDKYPVTHYRIMTTSFANTVAWMQKVSKGTVTSQCR